MSKLENAIKHLTEDRLAGVNSASYAVVTGTRDLGIVLDWVKRVREMNPFLIGDKVSLPVYDDPEGEEGHQPETGIVIGFAGGGSLLIRPDTGEYKDTTTGQWYDASSVERIED